MGAEQRAPIKEQLGDQLPKRFRALQFGVQSHQDIVNQGVLEVSDNLLYDVENGRRTFPHGPLDPRLGTSSKTGTCETCNLPLQSCAGHFGHVRLPLPVFHIGYLKYIQATLQNICKTCSKVLLDDDDKAKYLKALRAPGIDNLKRSAILKKINDECRKQKTCPDSSCQDTQGVIRKLSVMKLTHDKFSHFNKSTAQKKVPPVAKAAFDSSFIQAKTFTPDLEKHSKKAMDDMDPLKVLKLFKKITAEDCELLGLNPSEGRPEMFLWQYLPAPPICIRPSVQQEAASNEDDITSKLSEIILYAGHLRESLLKGAALNTIMEQWEFIQLQVGMYVNSDVPGLYQPGFGKPIRGFCQRLKGKQGRFRGNLSGKRVDFSGRTVISPDPNLGIDQVAVPERVAKNLTYPERVNRNNIEKLRKCVMNGPKVWPGAQGVIKRDGGMKFNLNFGDESIREERARELKFGDVVERHLEDGDIVLFNRQPSLHKLSIMSHRAKVRPWRTFRLNECVCTPYNADFDGDEMNLHLPQTEEARAEAINLMGVQNNLITPKNGEPIIAATQDFITAAYLLSSKDLFLDRKTFTYICTQMLLGETHLDLPPPTIIKPVEMWTGKQIFNVLMRPNKQSPVLVNLEAKNKVYKAKPGELPDMDIDDCYLVVRNSEVMCGRMDKSTVGGGKKNSVFYVILRDWGPEHAAQAMNRLAKLCARTLTLRGFSIGVGDVYPSKDLTEHKAKLVQDAYALCDDLIAQFKSGRLEKAPGCNMEETLENKISGILSKVRSQAGDYCVGHLSRNNSPLIMAKSGSKGSDINVAQMVALVGQQIIGGKRVADGFQDRTLFHFHKNARQPPSKGFVRNSFYTGLVPTEFLFHAISGREGLVDTAVKTAETGYMSRRLMKSLEDLSTQYDDTVRTSEGNIVQFQYGADRLDPADMEGNAKPVDFERSWNHAESLTMNHSDRSLLPAEISAMCREILDERRKWYVRKHLVTGELLHYEDKTIAESDDHDVFIAIDEHEGARVYLNTIQAEMDKRALKLAKARRLAGLDPCLSQDNADLLKEFAAWEKKQNGGDIKMLDPEEEEIQQAHVDRVAKVSEATLRKFMNLCLSKFDKAKVEPGHAVGAVGAQSIGEPGTQMTLKTFHFAGVAGMSITQGVPRIKEIIGASKLISTPVISCELENNQDIKAARIVKGKIEKTFISDVITYVEDVWLPDVAKIVLKIDMQALSDMQLGIGLREIMVAIVKAKKLKLKVEMDDLKIGPDNTIEVIVNNDWKDLTAQKKAARVRAAAIEKGQLLLTTSDETAADFQLRVNFLKRMLPAVPISGYPEAFRAIIQSSESNEHKVLVEGYGLRACMTTEGVIGTKCISNSIMECRDVLGIEAARTTIAKEIGSVMGDMGIDPRHMDLLADVMTYKGEILGITRHGLAKMRDSVLQLASFERTPDHLFDAAAGMKTDRILGVSECIIMGQTMKIGTGAFQVVRRLGIRDHQVKPKKSMFEEVWKKDEAEKRRAKMEMRKTAAAAAASTGRGGKIDGMMPAAPMVAVA